VTEQMALEHERHASELEAVLAPCTDALSSSTRAVHRAIEPGGPGAPLPGHRGASCSAQPLGQQRLERLAGDGA